MTTSRFVDDPDYRLAWPAAALRAELGWLAASVHLDNEAAIRVFEEAFESDQPAAELRERSTLNWGGAPPGLSDRELVRELLAVVDQLPAARRIAPLWHQRRGVQLSAPAGGAPGTGSRSVGPHDRFDAAFTRYVSELSALGYFRRAAPEACVDDDSAAFGNPAIEMDLLLADMLGVRGLWPLSPQNWDEDTRWALVEALGELVARPRRREWHDFNGCGWHCSQFVVSTAQILYRARVNELLQTSDVPLRMADDGEDVGRLVRVSDKPREELVERALSTPIAADRDEVTHAIALFRARAADREAKRSAVFSLARVLEDRRTHLKQALLSKDESALFHIANGFDLRHRRADQHPDYDDAYLDWVFWLYLATIALSDSLIARQSEQAPQGGQ